MVMSEGCGQVACVAWSSYSGTEAEVRRLILGQLISVLSHVVLPTPVKAALDHTNSADSH